MSACLGETRHNPKGKTDLGLQHMHVFFVGLLLQDCSIAAQPLRTAYSAVAKSKCEQLQAWGVLTHAQRLTSKVQKCEKKHKSHFGQTNQGVLFATRSFDSQILGTCVLDVSGPTR